MKAKPTDEQLRVLRSYLDRECGTWSGLPEAITNLAAGKVDAIMLPGGHVLKYDGCRSTSPRPDE